MTTATMNDDRAGSALTPGRSPLWRKSVAVFRMHFTDAATLIVFPGLLLGSIFAITLIVWAVIPGTGGQGWGEMSIFFFLLSVAALAVTRALPFSLGMGASRRAFLLGTLLTGLVLSVGWGVVLFVLQRIEEASEGWGQHVHFFWWAWYGRSAWPDALPFLITSLAASFSLGVLLAACWVRWDRSALLVGGPVAVLTLGGSAILATSQHWWGDAGHLLDLSPLGATGVCVAVVGVFTALQYAVLQRVHG